MTGSVPPIPPTNTTPPSVSEELSHQPLASVTTNLQKLSLSDADHTGHQLQIDGDMRTALNREITGFNRDSLSKVGPPNLIDSMDYVAERAIRITLGSLFNFSQAQLVEVKMIDGSTLVASDNINKNTKPEFTRNCFGHALTAGSPNKAIWFEKMNQWLEHSGQILYEKKPDCSCNVGDLAIWRSEELGIQHAAVVTAPGEVNMASGTMLFNETKDDTATVPIEEGWQGRGAELEIWGLTSAYNDLVSGSPNSEQLKQHTKEPSKSDSPSSSLSNRARKLEP